MTQPAINALAKLAGDLWQEVQGHQGATSSDMETSQYVSQTIARAFNEHEKKEAVRKQFCKLLGFADFYSWEAIYDQVKLLKESQ